MDYKTLGVGTPSSRGTPPLKFFYSLNLACLMGDITRMDDVISVATWGRGVGSTPPPNFFGPKMLFFTYFTKIRSHKTTKNWGSPLGRHPPLKNFLNSKLGLASAFSRILPWLD